MPFESQVVVGAIILVFAFFMVLVAWAERRAGGSFADAIEAKLGADAASAPVDPQPAAAHEERQAA